jgi:8-oxo-dGTP pyrophosphatase MutT (NUDIX family)
MKVIFLDNDGVICLSNNWGSRNTKRRKAGLKASVPSSELPVDIRFDNFDKKAVRILNEILEETGAEIVVSSDWRFYATLEELGEYYTSQGIIKRPIAVTGMFKDLFPREWMGLRFRADLELERSMEIGHWLENHSEVTHWVAVDDLDMSVDFLEPRFSDSNGSDNKPGLTNFVLTPKVNEGIKQCSVKDKILQYLSV